MSHEALLQVRGLQIGFPEADGTWSRAVDQVSLEIGRGQRLAIVGESGSGKSLTALACLGLVPEPGRLLGGTVTYGGIDLFGAPADQLAKIRGAEIGLDLQEASGALNPVFTIGFQIQEAISIHSRNPTKPVKELALGLLAEVAIDDPEIVARAYPHELSGGQAQRVMLALALAGRPKILVADEPTSAVDVMTQRQILELLGRLCDEQGLGLVLISHDLAVVREMVDRVMVMYRGVIVEAAPQGILFSTPRHPYTCLLMGSAPGSELARGSDNGHRNKPVAGRRGAGCAFYDRCELARESCRRSDPDLIEIGRDHFLRCPIVADRLGEGDDGG